MNIYSKIFKTRVVLEIKEYGGKIHTACTQVTHYVNLEDLC